MAACTAKLKADLAAWLGEHAACGAAPPVAPVASRVASVLAAGTPPSTQLAWEQIFLVVPFLFDDAIEEDPASASGLINAALAILAGKQAAASGGATEGPCSPTSVLDSTAAEAAPAPAALPEEASALLGMLASAMGSLWHRLDGAFGERPWPAWLERWSGRFSANLAANFAAWRAEAAWVAAGHWPSLQDYMCTRVRSFGALWVLAMRELTLPPGSLELAAGGPAAADSAGAPESAAGMLALSNVLEGRPALQGVAADTAGAPSAGQLLAAHRTLLSAAMALQNDVLSAAKEHQAVAAGAPGMNAVLLLAASMAQRRGGGSRAGDAELAQATSQVVSLVDALFSQLEAVRQVGASSIRDTAQLAAFLQVCGDGRQVVALVMHLEAHLLRERYGAEAVASLPPAWLETTEPSG